MRRMLTRKNLGAATFALLFAAFSALSAATPSPVGVVPSEQGSRSPVRDLAIGKMLVAARGLRDSNFRQTVVLLFAYSSRDGAAGVIVNRKTDVKVARLLPDLPMAKGQEPVVFFGGPVGAGELRGLLRSPIQPASAARLLNDLGLITSSEALEQAVAEGATAERLHVFTGYAGWSPGQLEREIERDDWHVTNGNSAEVFARDTERVWLRQIQRTDLIEL